MTANTDESTGTRERERLPSDRLPGDELYMMSGGVYILCSVRRPSTQWIATTAVDDLKEWQ